MIRHSDLRVDQVITYEAFSGTRRTVRITELHDDIKNGRPGFDCEDVIDGTPYWGYTEQITSVR